MNVDEIFDRLNVIGDGDTGGDTKLIAKSIDRLPVGVQKFAVANLWFLWPPDAYGAAYTLWLPPNRTDDLKTMRIVLLHPTLADDKGEPEAIITIAHEIAHHWLRHVGNAHGVESFEARESQVDEQLIAWGF